MTYKPFLPSFFNPIYVSYNCQIKMFTWCLEGSTFPIRMAHPFVACPPFDNFKTSPTYMLFQVLKMTTMTRQNTKFPPIARLT